MDGSICIIPANILPFSFIILFMKLFFLIYNISHWCNILLISIYPKIVSPIKRDIRQFLYIHLSLKETIRYAVSDYTSAFYFPPLLLTAMRFLYSVLMSGPVTLWYVEYLHCLLRTVWIYQTSDHLSDTVSDDFR